MANTKIVVIICATDFTFSLFILLYFQLHWPSQHSFRTAAVQFFHGCRSHKYKRKHCIWLEPITNSTEFDHFYHQIQCNVKIENIIWNVELGTLMAFGLIYFIFFFLSVDIQFPPVYTMCVNLPKDGWTLKKNTDWNQFLVWYQNFTIQIFLKCFY